MGVASTRRRALRPWRARERRYRRCGPAQTEHRRGGENGCARSVLRVEAAMEAAARGEQGHPVHESACASFLEVSTRRKGPKKYRVLVRALQSSDEDASRAAVTCLLKLRSNFVFSAQSTVCLRPPLQTHTATLTDSSAAQLPLATASCPLIYHPRPSLPSSPDTLLCAQKPPHRPHKTQSSSHRSNALMYLITRHIWRYQCYYQPQYVAF